MAQTSSADAFDYSAINLHMAKQLVKDLLEAFDAEGNRTRLARALVTAQEKTDQLMLTVTPLAIDIASVRLYQGGASSSTRATPSCASWSASHY